MWRQRLHSELVQIGLRACQADPDVHRKHKRAADGSWKCVLLLSTHVDGLNGDGCQEEVDLLVQSLTKAFGEDTLDYGSFEHCGATTGKTRITSALLLT